MIEVRRNGYALTTELIQSSAYRIYAFARMAPHNQQIQFVCAVN